MRCELAAFDARAWIALAPALAAAAAGAAEPVSLIDLPVAGRVVVPATQFRDAAARAARKGSPVEIALAVAGAFEGKQQLIVQVNEGAESPSAARVSVIRDGLLDDAVSSQRWDIDLTRTAAGDWQIRKVGKAWRCWRGAASAGFGAQPCP
jgi:hypothetical protein